VKLSDLRLDSWVQIIKQIERGDRPADQYLHAALMRGELLSPERQRILTKLFDGSLRKGKGRPTKNGVFDKMNARFRAQQQDLTLYLGVKERAEELRKSGCGGPTGRGDPGGGTNSRDADCHGASTISARTKTGNKIIQITLFLACSPVAALFVCVSLSTREITMALKPLTSLKREAEQVTGRSIPLAYRDIYTAAVDGAIPAEQVRGRWHFDPANVKTIAAVLMREGKNVTA
jgi:hypothetical protein